MAVDQTWTDPSTGGAVDLSTGDILTETIYDKILSNIKRIGGTTGPTNVQATRGAFPVSGYVMGAVAHDVHVESGIATIASANTGGHTTTSVTFGNAFAAAPAVTTNVQASTTVAPEGIQSHAISVLTTGATIDVYQTSGSTATAVSIGWIACGSDV